MTDRDDTRRRIKETLVTALQLEVDATDLPDDEPLFAAGVASIATLELFESINSIVDYVERVLNEKRDHCREAVVTE